MGRIFAKKEKKPFISAVIAAGGSSERMGGNNKLLAEIDGIPVLVYALMAFDACPEISEIILSAKQDMVVEYTNLAKLYGISKLKHTVAGGKSRLESVYKAVIQVSDECQYIAVHDGARPLITQADITKICREAVKSSCAFAASAVSDTIKQVADGIALKTLDRTALMAAQTPQIALKELMQAALSEALQKGLAVTDECSALELMGVKPVAVLCDNENIKITKPIDLICAQAILEHRRNGSCV